MKEGGNCEEQLISEVLNNCGWPSLQPAARLRDKAILVKFYREIKAAEAHNQEDLC